MNSPKVSIILPVHNRSDLMRRAVESVLVQSFTDFELIIVDDASQDDTYDVARSYESDPRVRVFRADRNRGPSGARNVGIDEAKGTYIAFQDSDDRWLPDKLARQVERLDAEPDADVCYCGAVYVSRELCYQIPIAGRAERLEGDLSREILKSNPTTPQTLLIRREILEQTGLFDEALKINVDWDLAIRLAQVSSFVFVDDPLVMIYRTPDSVSSNRLRDAYCREQLLAKYAHLYGRDADALSLQHYIAASYFRRFGHNREATRHFRQSFQAMPRFKSFARMLLSSVEALAAPRPQRAEG